MDTTPTLMGWCFFVYSLAISIKMCYTVSVLQKTYHFDSRGSTIPTAAAVVTGYTYGSAFVSTIGAAAAAAAEAFGRVAAVAP